MPLRLDLTPEQHLERIREQTRERVKRYREKRNATGNASSSVTQAVSDGAAHATPPHTPPVSSLPLLERKKIEHLLSGFAPRGYKHDARFWELLRTRYPRLDLELEVMKLSEWLDEPRNAKRKCSKTFIANWLSKADQDRREREALPAVPAPSSKGVVVNGTWHPPTAFQRNPGPPPEDAVPLTAPLETFTREELARLREEHARVPFKDKLAAKAALATNGTHR